jgi:NAD(P)-dependent dehydrogenase (short-subunit alcohol dehydrogenase family)
MFSYEGKKVIVTGAGRGIGRATALAMAGQGADVTLASRTESQLNEVAAEIEALGRKAWVMTADVADLDQGLGLIAKAHETMGGLDVLVNNAGGGSSVPGGLGPLEESTPEGFDAIYALNVRVPFFMCQAAARHMADGGGGAICNIVSIDGVFPAPLEGVYGSAKAALISLTATLAVELGRHNVRINAVAPALVDTPLVARHIASDDARADRASFYPINRIGKAEDIAAAAVYLCSDDAAWTSGETLLVAGGQKAASDAIRWLRKVNPVPDATKF